jgi:hypothetical protein
VIGKTFTASMHKKANLRLTLESWRGRTFTEQEANDFDISTVLGQACMLAVIQKESGGNIYSNIGPISGLPGGVPKPQMESPAMLYTGENPDEAKNLPEWLQKKLAEQVKPQASHASGVYAGSDDYDFGPQVPIDAYENVHGVEIDSDDLPF